MGPTQDKFIEELYRKYFSRLTIYATAKLKDKTKAEVLCQDKFAIWGLREEN